MAMLHEVDDATRAPRVVQATIKTVWRSIRYSYSAVADVDTRLVHVASCHLHWGLWNDGSSNMSAVITHSAFEL